MTKVRDNFDTKHLIKLSKKICKPINGKSLVDYLRKNPPDINRNVEFDKDAAIQYAQSLLEANYITLVEIKSKESNF